MWSRLGGIAYQRPQVPTTHGIKVEEPKKTLVCEVFPLQFERTADVRRGLEGAVYRCIDMNVQSLVPMHVRDAAGHLCLAGIGPRLYSRGWYVPWDPFLMRSHR